MGLFNRKKTEEKDEQSKKQVSQGKKGADKGVASMKDLYKEDDKGAVVSKSDKKVKTAKKYGNAHKVLVKPLITEKAANLGVDNKYVFAVDTKANKIEIAKAVNEVYGVKPVSVNIVRVLGKKVRHGRLIGNRKNWKKAIVSLPKGKSINIYEGV